MTNVVTFNGKELELINQNNQLYMTLSQIASALEYNNSSSINDILTRNQSEFDDEMTCLIKHGRTRVRIFNREGCWLIGMFARTPKAAEFRKWVLKTLGEAADNKISAPALNKSDIRSALYDYFGEVMLNEEMLPKWRVMFQRWMKDVIFSEDYFEALKKLIIPWVKDAAAETLGKSIDAYIKAEMDERVKYFVEYVFKNYPKLSQPMKEYLITYGIVNYGKYGEYTRERDFRGICETIWRQEQKDPAVRYAA